jgi:hypothetical protein
MVSKPHSVLTSGLNLAILHLHPGLHSQRRGALRRYSPLFELQMDLSMYPVDVAVCIECTLQQECPLQGTIHAY